MSLKGPFAAPATEAGATAGYGFESDVQETVAMVKSAGDVSVISSHAIRLPRNPLRAITAFNYGFPSECGGHQFRVYEANGMQILEYKYAARDGDAYLIRDYVSGPSPFIRAGLWSAYDHTGDTVTDMNLVFEIRADGIMARTYSKGPVTGLNAMDQRVLGRAYDQAVRDTQICRG